MTISPIAALSPEHIEELGFVAYLEWARATAGPVVTEGMRWRWEEVLSEEERKNWCRMALAVARALGRSTVEEELARRRKLLRRG